ncbi:MAG: AbrB/MazE/SpoVT family DNA-binding domain-containing protein [Oscillospiraceae bacterium]|nr:AbrB/MazE/SpoVT family DNA-binding domain-containing protein [Oscillospiraceae bacterium]
MSKKPTSVRIIDELGRVTLPIEARKIMDWDEKTRVKIWVDPANRQLIMKTYVPACTYCGSDADLLEYREKQICRTCRDAIFRKTYGADA